MIPTNKSKPKHLKIEEQTAHEKPTKKAWKRHENPTSYKPGINATMKASIHSEVRFFYKLRKNLTPESKEMRSSSDGWFPWIP
jgi:hypothetical protein